jgi:hypothetical protein
VERIVDAENLDGTERRPARQAREHEHRRASEHGDLIARARERRREIASVDLSPAICGRRKPMNDLKDSHSNPADLQKLSPFAGRARAEVLAQRLRNPERGASQNRANTRAGLVRRHPRIDGNRRRDRAHQ